ncbi:MAG: hypothetical protein RQM92_03300 [Candidatus Syntrophopropionicum ammoniitolerans]
MVEVQLDDMLRNLEGRINSQGASMENYLKYANTTLEELREKMHPDASWSARVNLVMEAIARAEGIKATDEELKEEAAKVVKYYHGGEEEIQRMLENASQVSFLTDQIVREKTLQLLTDNAKFIEKAEEPVSSGVVADEPEIEDTIEPETE